MAAFTIASSVASMGFIEPPTSPAALSRKLLRSALPSNELVELWYLARVSYAGIGPWGSRCVFHGTADIDSASQRCRWVDRISIAGQLAGTV